MARLSKTEKEAFRRCQPWQETNEQKSPRILAETPEARLKYCLWAKTAAKFFKGEKPVRFGGDNWKL